MEIIRNNVTNQELRVLYVIPSLAKGGAQRLLLDICKELGNRKGFEYLIVILEATNEYKELSKGIKIVHCEVKIRSFKMDDLKNDLTAWDKILEEFKPDIIHSHLYLADLIATSRILPDVKYFCHVHGRTTQYEKLPVFKFFLNPKSYILHQLEKYYIKKRQKKAGAKVFTVSTYYKDYLLNNLGGSIVILPNAINCHLFYFPEEKNIGNPLRLISVGRLVKNKNHLFLLEVAAYLKEAGIIFEMIILGEGPLIYTLRQNLKELGLEEDVILKGNVENPEDFYQHSHIYLHSALDEPFGLALLEAMSAGLPVICLDGKGNRELIEQGKNGFMFAKPDVAGFAEKIIILMNNPDEYKKMSGYAKNFAAKYDIKLYVDRLVESYVNS